jgi:hypothetical protein
MFFRKYVHLQHHAECITKFQPQLSNLEKSRLAKACVPAWLTCKGNEFSLLYTPAPTCRSAAVDSGGKEINRNRLIALLSAIILSEHPGTTIVTDSVTSDGLTEFIEKLGRMHIPSCSSTSSTKDWLEVTCCDEYLDDWHCSS